MKKPGIREIARLADVSPGTVDRALHGRKGITAETRDRILKIAKGLGYRPDPAARALSTRRAPVEIGVCTPREIHYYFDYLRAGIAAEARRFERLGVRVLYRQTKSLGKDEAGQISALIDARVDALIVTPGRPDRIAPLIDRAEEQGIRVICVDTDAAGSKRSTVVSVDAAVSGRLAAELMCGCVPPASELLVFTGMLDTEDHARKTASFVDLVERCSGSTAEVIEAHEDEEEAFQKCFAALTSRPSIAGIYVNTANCLPVCRAVCAAGRSGKVKLIVTDLFEAMAPFFERETIFASIHGRPFEQGEITMRLAIDHLLNGTHLPRERLLLPAVVMRSNFRLFREISNSEAEAGVAVY